MIRSFDFTSVRTIAVIGLSDKPERPSYQVATYLQSKGFTIIPINPLFEKWCGIASYPSLSAVPTFIHIDVVDVFRNSDAVPGIVEEVLKRGGEPILWLQEGVTNPAAEQKAKDHGLTVISNVCLMKSHRAL